MLLETPKQAPRLLERISNSPRTDLVVSLTVVGLVLILSFFHISGSSIGRYEQIFPQVDANDDPLFGVARGIRSDEWLRWTPLTVSQAQNGFPEINRDLRQGIDLSVVYDVPHGGWLAWFEPQHFAYHLVGDVEFAFAFKWWFLIAAVFLSSYFFAQRFFDTPRVTALLMASFVALTPMLHWWWQSQAFLAMTYVFVGLTIVRMLEKSTTGLRRAFLGVSLGYVGLALAFLQYPPFLIGTTLPAVVFYLGHVGNQTRFRRDRMASYWRLVRLPILTALSLMVIGIAAYLVDKGAIVEAIGDSEHPGRRSFPSGSGNSTHLYHLLSSNMAPFFQSDSTVAGYFTNQSEASNFILVLPYLVLYLILMRVFVRDGRPSNVVHIALVALFVLSMVWFFMPGVSSLLSLTQLKRIPPNRLNMLFGFTQTLLLFSIVGRASPDSSKPVHETPWKQRAGIAGAVAIVAASVTFYANGKHSELYDGILKNRLAAIGFLLLFVLGIALIAGERTELGLASLVVLSGVSVFMVNPIQRGLGPILDAPIVEAIGSVGNPENRLWAVSGGLVQENLAIQAGQPSLSGSTPYTQTEFWGQLSTDPEVEAIYDRSAHFTLSLTEGETELELVADNVVNINLNPCGDFARTVNLGYVVTSEPVAIACLQELQVVPYANFDYFIYEVR